MAKTIRWNGWRKMRWHNVSCRSKLRRSLNYRSRFLEGKFEGVAEDRVLNNCLRQHPGFTISSEKECMDGMERGKVAAMCVHFNEHENSRCNLTLSAVHIGSPNSFLYYFSPAKSNHVSSFNLSSSSSCSQAAFPTTN